LKAALFGFEEAVHGFRQFAAVSWALNHSEPEYQMVRRPDDGRTSFEIVRDLFPDQKAISKLQGQVMEAERVAKIRLNETLLANIKKLPD
jgi:hypothetical protein